MVFHSLLPVARKVCSYTCKSWSSTLSCLLQGRSVPTHASHGLPLSPACYKVCSYTCKSWSSTLSCLLQGRSVPTHASHGLPLSPACCKEGLFLHMQVMVFHSLLPVARKVCSYTCKSLSSTLSCLLQGRSVPTHASHGLPLSPACCKEGLFLHMQVMVFHSLLPVARKVCSYTCKSWSSTPSCLLQGRSVPTHASHGLPLSPACCKEGLFLHMQVMSSTLSCFCKEGLFLHMQVMVFHSLLPVTRKVCSYTCKSLSSTLSCLLQGRSVPTHASHGLPLSPACCKEGLFLHMQVMVFHSLLPVARKVCSYTCKSWSSTLSCLLQGRSVPTHASHGLPLSPACCKEGLFLSPPLSSPLPYPRPHPLPAPRTG